MEQFPEPRYLATSDLLFKKVLASPGNEEILLEMINRLTNQQFESAKPLSPYNIELYKEAQAQAGNKLRHTEVDVRARTGTGEQVTIEMQLVAPRNFLKRVHFYAANTYTDYYANYDDSNKMLLDSVQTTDPYQPLRTVYSINIVANSVSHSNQAAWRIYRTLDEQTGEPITAIPGVYPSTPCGAIIMAYPPYRMLQNF
ncbi:PD-(D/E)XK nuclease family transposase [Hutsoniella sourekii]|uniref:PD-(D/E)XK nuclease family transposase n=1 Tax=Hutsoniella sourekii TaxID=87650 RepID=UPI0004829D64|nr:PD-(D/E)XK nuclease family transposase [Hutsoniella sourekii]